MTDHTSVHHIMGTAITFEVRDAILQDVHVNAVVEQACDRLREIDTTFSTYKETSQITRLGRGDIELDDCSDDVRMILDLCETLRFSTDGYFDIRAAAATSPAKDLQSSGPHPDPIEPSGLVKGWAIDEACEIMRTNGLENFSVNAGGDVYVNGFVAPETTWRIGLQHPMEKNKVMAVLAVHDAAIATSGNYERGNHIAGSDELTSLTLVGHDMTLTDAYATAAYAMGMAGIQWVAKQAGFEVFAVDRSGTTHQSAGLRAYLAG